MKPGCKIEKSLYLRMRLTKLNSCEERWIIDRFSSYLVKGLAMGSLWMPIASPIWNNATGWWFVIFSNDPNLVHGKASVACQNGGNHLHQGPNLGEWWLQEQEQDSAKNTGFMISPTFQTWENIYNIRRCRLRSCWCSCCICTIAPSQDPTDHIPKKSTLLKHVGQSFFLQI